MKSDAILGLCLIFVGIVFLTLLMIVIYGLADPNAPEWIKDFVEMTNASEILN